MFLATDPSCTGPKVMQQDLAQQVTLRGSHMCTILALWLALVHVLALCVSETRGSGFGLGQGCVGLRLIPRIASELLLDFPFEPMLCSILFYAIVSTMSLSINSLSTISPLYHAGLIPQPVEWVLFGRFWSFWSLERLPFSCLRIGCVQVYI